MGRHVVDFPRYTPMSGEWFYGAKCTTCGLMVPFTLDPDDGKGPSQIPAGWVEMTCDKGHVGHYQASAMLRVRHP